MATTSDYETAMDQGQVIGQSLAAALENSVDQLVEDTNEIAGQVAMLAGDKFDNLIAQLTRIADALEALQDGGEWPDDDERSPVFQADLRAAERRLEGR